MSSWSSLSFLCEIKKKIIHGDKEARKRQQWCTLEEASLGTEWGPSHPQRECCQELVISVTCSSGGGSLSNS